MKSCREQLEDFRLISSSLKSTLSQSDRNYYENEFHLQYLF